MYHIPVLTMAKDNRVSAFFIRHPHPRGLSCLGTEMRDHAVQGHNLVCRSAVSNKEGRDYVSERGPRSKPPMVAPAKTQIFIKQVRRVHLSPWFHITNHDSQVISGATSSSVFSRTALLTRLKSPSSFTTPQKFPSSRRLASGLSLCPSGMGRSFSDRRSRAVSSSLACVSLPLGG